MPTTRIVEKISDLVNSQLPEFIQNEYPVFSLFLKYYYEFLQQDQYAQELIQNARAYADIDRTAPQFVQYFLNTYAAGLSQNTTIDYQFLIKKIKFLYEAKGSELSYQALFKLLYDTDVSLKNPFENVLRPSDGVWEQLVSIRVRTTSGNANLLQDHFIKVVKSGTTYVTPVIKVKRLTEDLSEVFVKPDTVVIIEDRFEIGDIITVEENNIVVFTGILEPTPTTYNIISPGQNFKLGQIFTINYSGGVSTLIKVTGVSGSGGITKLQIIYFGYNFPTTSFNINLLANQSVAFNLDAFISRTGGFGDTGTIQLTYPGDPSDYFFEDYVEFLYTAPVVDVYDDSYTVSAITTTGSASQDTATITFIPGAVARYPGSYVTNRGFLSEPDIRLQDDKLYQPFAYQTNTDIDITKFYNDVITLIHPAGQKLFNNRVLSNSIDLSANINVELNTEANPNFVSSVSVEDEIQISVV